MRAVENAWMSLLVCAVLATVCAAADDAGGDSQSLFTVTISGLHKLDDTISTVQNQGLGNYLTDQVKAAAREHFPKLFGDSADMVDQTINAGQDTYGIDQKATGTIEQGMQAITVQDNGQSSVDAQAASDQMTDSLARETEPEMLKQVEPEAVKAFADKIQSTADDAQWLAGKMQQGIDTVTDTARSLTNNAQQNIAAAANSVKQYFAGDESAVLEPGGTDQGVTQAATTSDGTLPPPDALAYADDTQSLVANQPADGGTGIGESNGVAASDDNGAGTDTSGAGATSNSAGTNRQSGSQKDAAELANELGISGDSGSGGPSDSARQDAAALANDLGLQDGGNAGKANLTQEAQDVATATDDWERQQAEQQRQAELARQQELARLQALEQQREQEEQARQLRAAQEYIAQQQAAQEAAAQQQTSAQSSSGFSSFVQGALGVLNQVQALKEQRQQRSAPAVNTPNPDAWFMGTQKTAPASRPTPTPSAPKGCRFYNPAAGADACDPWE